jgi:hypothetical protein
MMEAVRTSETSVDNHFTRQYNPEDNSEHHTRRRENLKSHNSNFISIVFVTNPSPDSVQFIEPTPFTPCLFNSNFNIIL